MPYEFALETMTIGDYLTWIEYNDPNTSGDRLRALSRPMFGLIQKHTDVDVRALPIGEIGALCAAFGQAVADEFGYLADKSRAKEQGDQST